MQQGGLEDWLEDVARLGSLVSLPHACMVQIEGSELCCSYLDNAEGGDTWTDTWKAPTMPYLTHVPLSRQRWTG